MRIDADASLPDYRVGEFALRAELDALRTGGRQGLLESLDTQRRTTEVSGDMNAMNAHYQRASTCWHGPKSPEPLTYPRSPRVPARTVRHEHSWAIGVTGPSPGRSRRSPGDRIFAKRWHHERVGLLGHT